MKRRQLTPSSHLVCDTREECGLGEGEAFPGVEFFSDKLLYLLANAPEECGHVSIDMEVYSASDIRIFFWRMRYSDS